MFKGLFGLWNRPTRTRFSVRGSGCVDDLHRVDIIRSKLGSDDGVADCIVAEKIIGCETAYPLGLIALQKELIAVHKMKRKLDKLQVDIKGVHTDGIFFTWSTLPESGERAEQERRLRDLLTWNHPDGTRIYALKDLPKDPETGEQKTHLVPSCGQKPLPPSPSPSSRGRGCRCWRSTKCRTPSTRPSGTWPRCRTAC